MEEKVNLTKKFIMVGMDDAMVSTDEKTIIGTQALATCTGVLIYNEEMKKAIVAHVSSEPIEILDKIFKLIIDNKLYRTSLKYKIIYGFDRGEAATCRGVIDCLKKHFDNFPMEELKDLSQDGIRVNENDFSVEFAFDASIGNFVTDMVLFGTDYYVVNNSEHNITNVNKCR